MKIKTGISGSVLKWIAVITMAIDHMGAGFLESYVMNAWGGSPIGNTFAGRWNEILSVDQILRYIGRPAFPIFCFLLVQGFLHTRDVKKYAIRLGIFALISEIPFDLALHIRPFHWQNQNVFFTLLLGLLAIWFMQSRGPRGSCGGSAGRCGTGGTFSHRLRSIWRGADCTSVSAPE